MKKVLLGLSLVGSLYAQTFTKSLDSIGWHNVGVPLDNIEINSTTFSDNISVVWRWNELTQSWEFYSNNESLKELAQSISVPVITSLNKGDALWVKNKLPESIILENNETNTCEIDNNEVDTDIVKLNNKGKIILNSSSSWSGIFFKDSFVNLMIALERSSLSFKLTRQQDEANKYCQDLVYMDFDDWRLPTTEEGEILQYYYQADNNILSLFKYKDLNSTATQFWNSEKSIGKFCINCYKGYSHSLYSFSFVDATFNTHKFITDSSTPYSLAGNKNYLCVRSAN